MGFQPYADHDIYRAIIFFKYMKFEEHIFNSYQGGPYYPKFPYTGLGVRISRTSWFWGQT